jgi:FkbM family methyltransferase
MHRGKTRAFRALAGRCFPQGMALSDSAGARIWIDPLDYIGWDICFNGSFEPRSLALAREIMSGGGTFLDVGANFGLFACTIATLPNVNCIAVEMSPTAFVKLQENLRRNAAARITAVNVALGSERSLVSLVPARPGNLGTGRVACCKSSPGEHRERVACMTLDELLGELNLGPIKLMKIDVEGHEVEVFRGLDFGAPYAPDHIISEYSETEAKTTADLEQWFQLLLRRGYIPFTVEGKAYSAGDLLAENNLWWHR